MINVFKLPYKSLRISYDDDVDVVDVCIASTRIFDPENAFWYKPANGFVKIKLPAYRDDVCIDFDQHLIEVDENGTAAHDLCKKTIVTFR